MMPAETAGALLGAARHAFLQGFCIAAVVSLSLMALAAAGLVVIGRGPRAGRVTPDEKMALAPAENAAE